MWHVDGDGEKVSEVNRRAATVSRSSPQAWIHGGASVTPQAGDTRPWLNADPFLQQFSSSLSLLRNQKENCTQDQFIWANKGKTYLNYASKLNSKRRNYKGQVNNVPDTNVGILRH